MPDSYPYTPLGPVAFANVTTAERMLLDQHPGLTVRDSDLGVLMISDGIQWTEYITRIQMADMFDAVIDAGYGGTLAGVYRTILEAADDLAISVFVRSADDIVPFTITAAHLLQRLQGKDADTTVLPVAVTCEKDNVTFEQLGIVDILHLVLSGGQGYYPTMSDLLVTGAGQIYSAGLYDVIKGCRFHNTSGAGLRFNTGANNYAGSEIVSCRFRASWVDIEGGNAAAGLSNNDFKFVDPHFLQGAADYFINATGGGVNDVKILGGSIYIEKDATQVIRLAGKGHLIQGAKFHFSLNAEDCTAITLTNSDAAYFPAAIQIIGNEIASVSGVNNLFFDCQVTPKHILFAFNSVSKDIVYGSALPLFKGAANMDWIGNELAGCTIDFDNKANQQVEGGDMTGCVLQNVPADLKIWNVKGIPQKCHVYHNAAQAIATGVTTKLAFNTERYDDGGANVNGVTYAGMHDTVTNNSRITCVIPGTYRVEAHAVFAASAVGAQRQINLLKNNTTGYDTKVVIPTAVATYMTCAAELQLVPGDYVEVQVAQDSGGNLNIAGIAGLEPEFWVTRVGP